MENATKALLIAAAVLVVIILIAFGMRILNTSSGTQDQADATMNSSKAQAFNRSFESYKGTRVNGASVRSLITAVQQNNLADATHKIEFGGVSAQGSVDDSKTYTVTFDYATASEANAGYIKKVTITANGTTTPTAP